MLALDEPTANIDSANIRGLYEAFAGLIEARRKFPGFQLALVTPDKIVAKNFCQLRVCDGYHHIRKVEQGCSKVERLKLTIVVFIRAVRKRIPLV